MGESKNNSRAEDAEALILSRDIHHNLNDCSFSTPEKLSPIEPLPNPSLFLDLQQKKQENSQISISNYMAASFNTEIESFVANESVNNDTFQASLTWREDEITGYDPEDPEDDGEGINGVGFRPSPAEAYDRMRKRKKQLAGYRKQEAKEARRLRRERRSICPEAMTNQKQEKKKRVRFKEAEIINYTS